MYFHAYQCKDLARFCQKQLHEDTALTQIPRTRNVHNFAPNLRFQHFGGVMFINIWQNTCSAREIELRWTK